MHLLSSSSDQIDESLISSLNELDYKRRSGRNSNEREQGIGGIRTCLGHSDFYNLEGVVYLESIPLESETACT